MTELTLDGIDFSSLPYGAQASITTLDGWFDSPDPKKSAVARLGRSGDFPASKVMYEPRYIELAANITAPDHDALHQVGSVLTGMLQREGTIHVSGHGTETWAAVERESRIRFSTITDTMALFSVTLKAPDPLRLGALQAFTNTVRNSVDAFHNGNAYAAPSVSITGTFQGGFTVYGSATTPFTYTDTIWSGSGDTITINFGTGVVLKNGALAPGGSVGRSLLTEIPPNGALQRMNVIPHSDTAWGSYIVNVHDSYL